MKLTIGNLAKKVGLPTKTIRFYEEIGLVDAPRRAENGYRIYTLDTVEKLSLIKNARDMGLPIPEIRKLMRGCVDGDCSHTKQYMQKEVHTYLHVLDEKIQQLEQLRQKLQNLEKNIVIGDNCDSTGYCCNILKQISDKEIKGGENK